MALFKCTMKLSLATNTSGLSLGRRIGGWSEGVYDIPSDAATMRRDFERLCARRATLLPVGAAVIGQRYQAVDPVGGTSTARRIFPGSLGNADIPQMAASFTCPSVGTPNQSARVLRGMPDVNVFEGEYRASDDYQRAFRSYLIQLNGYHFRGRNLQLDEIPVISIDADGNMVLGAPMTFDALNLLRVFKLHEDSFGTDLSGLYRIATKTSSTVLKLANWKGGARINGSCRVEGIIYPVLDALNASEIKVTTRKVGRPSDQYRGRASARA